jgi:uncharacterized protein (UPF0218 family)
MGRLFTRKEIESGVLTAVLKEASVVVSVGDRVTETLAGLGRAPDVQIVDSKENRKVRSPPMATHEELILVKNPAGYITAGAMEGVRRAFHGRKPARVLVDGEEDLLAIPAIALAPTSADVFYGQPGKGIVMVRAGSEAKARSKELLKEMGAPPIR